MTDPRQDEIDALRRELRKAQATIRHLSGRVSLPKAGASTLTLRLTSIPGTVPPDFVELVETVGDVERRTTYPNADRIGEPFPKTGDDWEEIHRLLFRAERLISNAERRDRARQAGK